ncbi:VgrG-related protein [Kitasatospora viridis]|uniref:Uncharacterized protein involved in type VI secretion and phage assembly n=1 Tax=Kitasatospora viridis TaxID=281105 RepID=A0A561UA82_9ACTN|nr:VgrG-related protein [Kitasatospora viridis]TWF96267.1 uncharacterized protein involved in type VI secretion and phage assembly [Kitasatospora viridis]
MSLGTYSNILYVEIEGAPLPDKLADQLQEGWVDASVNVPAAFQLVFNDQGREITKDFPQLRIGAKAVLYPYTDGNKGAALVTGEITALESESDTTSKQLVVRGFDKAHRLLRTRRVAGYPNMTADEIVRTLAGKCGVPLGTVQSTSTIYELCTQPNVTDWDFLCRLARENDLYLFVDNLGLLQFTSLLPASAAPPDTVPAAQSQFVLDFETTMLRSRATVTAAGQVSEVDVRGWNVAAKRALTALTPTSGNPDVLPGTTPDELVAVFGTARLTGTEVPFDTQAEVTKASKGLMEDITAGFAELEVVVVGNPELKPGRPVAVKGAGQPFEGRYTVTGTRHVFSGGTQYQTWVTVTGRQFRSLYGLASGGADTAPRIPGVANALVTNIQDPLRQGRVKLSFPWLSEDYESDWCRVAQFGGVRGGGLMLPDVHDEVLVAFDRGSLDHPYVIAGLYNGIDRPTPDPDGIDPVDGTSGAVNWRSVANRRGDIVELLEAETHAERGIRLRTGDRTLKVHLDDTSTKITIQSDGSILIDGTTTVSVQAGADLNLQAGGTVSIKAGGAVNINAGGAVAIEAVGDASMSAAGAVSMEAAGDASVTAAGAVDLTAVGTLTAAAVTVELAGIVTANGLPVV